MFARWPASVSLTTELTRRDFSGNALMASKLISALWLAKTQWRLTFTQVTMLQACRVIR